MERVRERNTLKTELHKESESQRKRENERE